MKNLNVIALLGLLGIVSLGAGCSNAPLRADPGGAGSPAACEDPRPQVCTQDYRPVCGVKPSGETATYGNACTACGDPDVVRHEPGECPETAMTMCRDPRPEVCTAIYDPVCATLADETTKTHASDCSACADPAVVGHRKGECP